MAAELVLIRERLAAIEELLTAGANRPEVQHLVIEMTGDDCVIDDALQGKRLLLVVGEDAGGQEYYDSDLLALAMTVTATDFTDRLAVKLCTGTAYYSVLAGNNQWVAMASDDLSISFDTGHGLTALHFFYTD